MVIQSGLAREMDLVATGKTAEAERTLPPWCLNIIRQFGKTILKPIIKLRPNGEVNWRNYGKLVGIVERYKAFVIHDVPRILEEELGDVTDEQWKKIEPLLGLDKVRARLIKVLERTVAADEPVGKLVDEVWERQSERLEQQRRTAFFHVAQQSPRVASLFFKGMKQQIITVMDQSETGERLAQPIEYALSDEEKPVHAGKLQDKVINLGIRELLPFGGRLRARGKIVGLVGKQER